MKFDAMKRFFLLILAISMLWGCDKNDDGEKLGLSLDEKNLRREEIRKMVDTDGLTSSNFPFIDCSTSTSPLRDMVMYNILGIPYCWSVNMVTGSQYYVTWNLPEGVVLHSDEHKQLADDFLELKKSNGSHEAFVNLIEGKTDLIIDSRDISRSELEYSAEKGVKVLSKPLAWDAMVFLVHPENKVKSLTIEQIQDIYTGKITNWKQVGGGNREIHPYMRDPDSGSQEKMETMVMKGMKMLEWPEMVVNTMLSPYMSVMDDRIGIGYSPYYFCERMVRDLYDVKVLAIDGVKPSPESILKSVRGESGGYPFYSQIYAAIRADEPSGSVSHQIYDWFDSPSARSIVDESGYIPLK